MGCITRHRLLWLILLCWLSTGCGSTPLASALPTVTVMPLQRGTIPVPPRSSTPTPLAYSHSPAPTVLSVSATERATRNTPHIVDHLSLDQPWLWIQTSTCNYRAGVVLAVSNTGELQQLQTPVVAVVERISLSPLLITCPTDDQFALVDTQTWIATPLTVLAGTLMQGFLASPDGTQVAFTTSFDHVASGRKSPYSLSLADVQTGAVRTLLDGDTLLTSKQVAYGGDLIFPIAWSGQTLYTHTQASASSSFWQINVTDRSPTPHEVLLVGETGPWAIAPNGTAMVWDYSGQPLYLRDLRTKHDRVLRPTATAYTHVLMSPDSHTLALIEADANLQCCELRLFDLTSDPPQSIGRPVTVSGIASIQGSLGWEWSPDSQRLLFLTERQAMILDRTGVGLGPVNLPTATVFEALRFVPDDQALLITRNDTDVTLHAISLTKNASNRIPDMPLPDTGGGGYTIVYTPPPRPQPDLDATAQATPFDGGVTIETEQCCTSGPHGMTDRLSVRLDAFSKFGAIQAMRVLVEPGQDCGGRSPDPSAPRLGSVNAPWEPYTNLRRDYTVAVPQERLRIIAQFRDIQGHVFPTPAGCDDGTGLGMTSITPTP